MSRNRNNLTIEVPQRAPPPIPFRIHLEPVAEAVAEPVSEASTEERRQQVKTTPYGTMTDEQYEKYMESVVKHRSRTRLVFVNHLDVLVKVYWFRSTEPDKLHKCCEVLPSSQGGCEGKSLATKYIYGTRLKLIWKDSLNNPQHIFSKVVRENQTIHIGEDPCLRWKNSAIKMQYLLHQMIRLGGTNETVYPNLAPLLDLVNDIEIPDITENDKQNAGIPSVSDIE